MSERFAALLARVHELHDLEKAASLLEWDRQVNMPKAGNESRVKQLTTLRRLTHAKFTSDEMGRLIELAADDLDGAGYESDEASLIRFLRREYEDARNLPSEFVARRSEISGKAHAVWVEARENDDFASFAPWLEQVMDLGREMAELYGYQDELYDALLDRYERGARTKEVRALFAKVKEETATLLEAIEERGRAVDDRILHQHYDVDKQKEFARYIAGAVGYDFSRGHLGTAVHPFASSFSRDDARITSRWYPHYLSPSLFGALHESGHAIYEQGTHPDLARTPLARGTSMGLHESQSRTFENIVGRSRGFWQRHFPKLQELFPAQLGEETPETFYRAVNAVQPSLIRVEADELTYNLHIVLRFELEQEMLNGNLQVDQLPAAWNDRMEELLGVVPETDREGILQDVHWTRPTFGYFPTYALGNLYAAQFHEAALQQAPAIEAELSTGKTEALLSWLRTNIHQHGSKFKPAELVQRVTGRPLSHEPFIKYATQKFSDVYGL